MRYVRIELLVMCLGCAHVRPTADSPYAGAWRTVDSGRFSAYGAVEYRPDGTFIPPLSPISVDTEVDVSPCIWRAVRGGILTGCGGYLPSERSFLVRDGDVEYLIRREDRRRVCEDPGAWTGEIHRPDRGAPGLDRAAFCHAGWRSGVRRLP